MLSCYTFDLDDRFSILQRFGFEKADCSVLARSLRRLTNRVIDGTSDLLGQELTKIAELKQRQAGILASNLPPLRKVFWLLEDCTTYGTLPFAGIARAGFIGVQLLRSLVACGVLSSADYQAFFQSLRTVQSNLLTDFNENSIDSFLAKYGHLRPGTYDILSKRYDEAPHQYFDWSKRRAAYLKSEGATFHLSSKQLLDLGQLINEHELDTRPESLLRFIRLAIEAREEAKFIFSKSISDALVLLTDCLADHGISREDASFLDIATVRRLYSSSVSPETELHHAIEVGKQSYRRSQSLTLPPLITCKEDFFSFHLPVDEPNFVTLNCCIGEVVSGNLTATVLQERILMIPSADPGYDWIFSHRPAAFITMYGGRNSHMAIRANELGIPAVIGAGETLYKRWATAKSLQIDCANCKVYVLQ